MSLFAMLLLAIASLAPYCVLSAHDLNEKYQFHSVLFNGQDANREQQSYILHWSFDLKAKTIAFAVNVSTTGWVGFGLSPNGQMPGSDVVIGWVDDEGQVQFHDRYAEDRFLPAIDQSQDWFLVSGEEEDGHTILEFTRNLTSCDDKDMDIKAVTARVVWSWSTDDPSSPSVRLTQHTSRGSRSLNLLGGLINKPEGPESTTSFTIAVQNFTIPHDVDTTYWCYKYRLPDEILETKRYITKYSTVIEHSSSSYVHHMLIYLCPRGEESEVQGACEDQTARGSTFANVIVLCRRGILIASWDFVYPKNVAYPIGGTDSSKYLMLEIHYDNPNLEQDVRDNSGMQFFYSDTKRQHDAAVTTIGHRIVPTMFIPPNANSYIVAAQCSTKCTQNFYPPEGIKIFANFLHTHLIGVGVELRHIRWNPKCNGYEELAPIDSNPNYDFDYQQTNFLPQEITVFPGDVLIVECQYKTKGSDRSNITLGGVSTREEMCLSFITFYPAVNMGACGSQPSLEPSNPFIAEFAQENVPEGPQRVAVLSWQNGSSTRSTFDPLEWTTDQVEALEDAFLRGPRDTFCVDSQSGMFAEGVGFKRNDMPPVIRCHYKEPDSCSAVSGGEESLISAPLLLPTLLFISAICSLPF